MNATETASASKRPRKSKETADPLFVSQRDRVLQAIATEAAEEQFHRNPQAIATHLDAYGYVFLSIRNPSPALAEALLSLNGPMQTAEGEVAVNRKSNAATVTDYAFGMREGRWDRNGQPLKFSVNPDNGWAIPPATWDPKAEINGAKIGPFDAYNYPQHALWNGAQGDDATENDLVCYAGEYGRAVCGSDCRHRLTAYLRVARGESLGKDDPLKDDESGRAKAAKRLDVTFEVYLSTLAHRRLIRNQDTGRARSVAEQVLLAESPEPVNAWVSGIFANGKPDETNPENFKAEKNSGAAPLKVLTGAQVAALRGGATRAASGLILPTPVVSPPGKFRVDKIEAFGLRQNGEGYTFAEALRDVLAEPNVQYFMFRQDESWLGAYVPEDDAKDFAAAMRGRQLIWTAKDFILGFLALCYWKDGGSAKVPAFVGGLISGNHKAGVSNTLSDLTPAAKETTSDAKKTFALVMARAWLQFTEGKPRKTYVPPHLTLSELSQAAKDKAEAEETEAEDGAQD